MITYSRAFPPSYTTNVDATCASCRVPVGSRGGWLRCTIPLGVAHALKTALDESQLSYRAAAKEIGIAHSYLHALARGTRCPTRPVAKSRISVLPIDADDAVALLREAIEIEELDGRRQTL